jgi:hypothetical protein
MKRIAILLICCLLSGCAGSFPWEHTVIALTATTSGEALGSCWAGAAVGTAAMFAREEAQNEYRLIERKYGGQRSRMPAFAGVTDWSRMDSHSWGDFLIPAAASFGACAVIHAYKKGWFGFKF